MFFMWNLTKFLMYPIWRASIFFFSRILECHSVKFAKKIEELFLRHFNFILKTFLLVVLIILYFGL